MSIVQVGANNYSLDSRVVVEGLASTINEFYGYDFKDFSVSAVFKLHFKEL